MKLLIVAAASGAVFGLWVVRVYNRLVRLRNAAENAFSTVDVQLKQRCDLVPNVVAAVKGYMEHERETLRRLTEPQQVENVSLAEGDVLGLARTGLAVAADRAHDEARIRGRQGRPSDAELVHDAGAKALDHDVGHRGERSERREAREAGPTLDRSSTVIPASIRSSWAARVCGAR